MFHQFGQEFIFRFKVETFCYNSQVYYQHRSYENIVKICLRFENVIRAISQVFRGCDNMLVVFTCQDIEYDNHGKSRSRSLEHKTN